MADKTIWKYEVDVTDEQIVGMPSGALILSAQMQGGDPRVVRGRVTLWVMVNPDMPEEPITIYIRGTGHPLPAGAVFVDTVQDGSLVWHVFTKFGYAEGPRV